MKLLREIPNAEIDAMTRAEIARCALSTGTRATVFEGLITRKIRILFHGARKPSKAAVRAFADEELAALPAASEVTS